MKFPIISLGLTLSTTTCLLSGCGAMHSLEETRKDTRTVGLMVKSVSSSVESFQKQRDAIAAASLRNRQALEALAMQYEASSMATIAAWEIGGDTKRKELFTRVHTQADALARANEQRATRKAEQENELAKARSAVNANTAKLTEASIALIKLGEAKSAKDDASFYLQFAKETQAEIAKASETAASAAKNKVVDATTTKGAH
ncbi:hypothetical protein [Comamonas thiooxydans]|uniref:hypothetical protein n=1 Tax=Comamonas thiooxydans TaxID=363952 RepID=UPI0001BB17A1|nr:hypothetical protein [Comamonas thiooxydans]ACY33173.1 hypothetical protein CtCNB1_2427 [Comamonas thiooxydans]MDO1475520.1 hypothetical protein [Comamonas thiooxydans]